MTTPSVSRAKNGSVGFNKQNFAFPSCSALALPIFSVRLKTGHSGARQNQPGDRCEKGW
jgi:hypothetical protein